MSKRALIVACSCAGTDMELSGTMADAGAISNMLQETYGVDGANIKYYNEGGQYSEQPTGTAVRTSFKEIASSCAEGDSLLFYFSGNGVRLPGPPGSAPKWGLLLTDLDVLTRDDFNDVLASLPAGCKFTAIIDAGCSHAMLPHPISNGADEMPRYFKAEGGRFVGFNTYINAFNSMYPEAGMQMDNAPQVLLATFPDQPSKFTEGGEAPPEGEPVAEGLEEQFIQRPRRRWGRHTPPGAVAEGAEGDGDDEYEEGEEDEDRVRDDEEGDQRRGNRRGRRGRNEEGEEVEAEEGEEGEEEPAPEEVVEAAPDEEEAPPPKEDDLPAEGEPVAEGLEERTMQRPRRRWGRYTQPGAVAEGAEGDGDEEDGEEDDEGRRSRRERNEEEGDRRRRNRRGRRGRNEDGEEGEEGDDNEGEEEEDEEAEAAPAEEEAPPPDEEAPAEEEAPPAEEEAPPAEEEAPPAEEEAPPAEEEAPPAEEEAPAPEEEAPAEPVAEGFEADADFPAPVSATDGSVDPEMGTLLAAGMYRSYVADGAEGGAFTRALVNAVAASPDGLSNLAVIEAIVAALGEGNFNMTPALVCSEGNSAAPFFAAA